MLEQTNWKWSWARVTVALLCSPLRRRLPQASRFYVESCVLRTLLKRNIYSWAAGGDSGSNRSVLISCVFAGWLAASVSLSVPTTSRRCRSIAVMSPIHVLNTATSSSSSRHLVYVDWHMFATLSQTAATTLCLKKVPTFKDSVTLSSLNQFSKFLHWWKAYRLKCATRNLRSFPPHLDYVVTLLWEVNRSNLIKITKDTTQKLYHMW